MGMLIKFYRGRDWSVLWFTQKNSAKQIEAFGGKTFYSKTLRFCVFKSQDLGALKNYSRSDFVQANG